MVKSKNKCCKMQLKGMKIQIFIYVFTCVPPPRNFPLQITILYTVGFTHFCSKLSIMIQGPLQTAITALLSYEILNVIIIKTW